MELQKVPNDENKGYVAKIAGNEPEVAGRSETCCEEPVCQAKGFDFVLKAMRNY